ncbi:MAG TPA: hypothetical protein VK590_13085 [Saprospiraceae bacterium]|nr:hypothetical protein [Saprospiraceae bacterium]
MKEKTIEDLVYRIKQSKEKPIVLIGAECSVTAGIPMVATRDSESFYNYYNDISKKVKERKIDILLVVNMFLTGFDSPTLNTIYVDKNLKYHGLIQAYSRTNRILNELKSQGNVVVFRNLKKATDEAITLFSNKDAIDVIIMEPYEDYVGKFDQAFEDLQKITPTVNRVC